MVNVDDFEDVVAEDEFEGKPTAYAEIKMGGGWYITISMEKSERFGNEYVEIAKMRSDKKRSRFNLSPKQVRNLGETLIKFADDNNLDEWEAEKSE